LALERYPRNTYVLDLAAQIAIHTRDDSVETYLSGLEEVDTRAFYHRRATLRSELGQWELALADAEIACDTESPRFEALAQRAHIRIEKGQLSAAEARIRDLAPFEMPQQDVKHGLQCKLHLRRGEWQRAEESWRRIYNKSLPVHRALRAEIVRQKSQDTMVAPAKRRDALAELAQLGEPQLELPLVFADEEME
jgi:uncharacterized protein HemY